MELPLRGTVMLGDCSGFPANGLIEDEPEDWRSLQSRSAAILNESGLAAETDRELKLVRGIVKVDVHASDEQSTPPSTLIVECKYWSRPVSKSVVHTFRTVISDSGVNTGMIVSRKGFQRGAKDAADKSNCILTDWSRFNSLFIDRWIANYFVPGVRHTCEVIQQYTEPMNSGVFRAADQLSATGRARFVALRERYAEFGYFTMALSWGFSRGRMQGEATTLPLDTAVVSRGESRLGAAITGARTFRALLEGIASIAEVGTTEFNDVFGEEIPTRIF